MKIIATFRSADGLELQESIGDHEHPPLHLYRAAVPTDVEMWLAVRSEMRPREYRLVRFKVRWGAADAEYEETCSR